MDIDFTPFFKQYEALAIMADGVFDRVKTEHADCVTCRVECADCCHALFDLTLIEALYINHHFNRAFTENEKENLLEIANQSDRKTYKIKRRANRDLQNGKAEKEVLDAVAEARVRCPLLSDSNTCRLYGHRPITCRLYGIPTAINGTGHSCGKSGFVKGVAYATVNMDAIHRKLFEISADLIKSIKSRHLKMATMLVPLSMALLTAYDDAYLGISDTNTSPDGNTAPGKGK